MSYREIINKNKLISKVSWWPCFAYHMTDIKNAVNILINGKLYSRVKANNEHLMENDNASKKIIDITSPEIWNDVRFYFRPLTPTQYHNEGYKHKKIRDLNQYNASMPVPIFFLFKLETLLQDDKTRFSNFGQGGNGSYTYSGEEEFAKLEFKYIYSNGYSENDNYRYRLAELLYPNEYDIDKSLYKIVCRNEVERLSLLNLLKEKDNRIYLKYKDSIIVMDGLFEKNAIYIDDVNYNENKLSIGFANYYNKNKYIEKQCEKIGISCNDLDPIKINVILDWKSGKQTIKHLDVEMDVDYMSPSDIILKLPEIKKPSILEVKILIDEEFMCFLKFDLHDVIIM